VDEINDVLIVGAGAIGSAVAYAIHRKLPGVAKVLADPGRMERYAAQGFILNGDRVHLPLVPLAGPSIAGGEPDLIILAVKNQQLARAMTDMAPCVGERTLIMSLLNGITSEDDLARAFGRDKVLYAMILGIDAVREGNATSYSSSGTIHFGDESNPPRAFSERVSRIASFFDRTGVAYVVPEDMRRALWYKFMINVGINQASAVLRAPYGIFQGLPEARRVMESAMREVIALSQALGTGLSEGDLVSWYATLKALSPGAKTSMLQDIEAKRKTEVEAFAGTVVALGKKAGVPTPVNQLLFDLIRTIEQSY
jgi:2-dehydropantoate 2-reductase